MEKIRIAIVGAGKSGDTHAQAFSQFDEIIIERAMSNTDERLKQFASKYSIPKYSLDYNDVVRDATIDAVIIASPDKYHYEQVLAAIKAGKHVLCEKPLCRTAAEAEHLVEEAEKAGIVFMVGFVERFNHPFYEAKLRIQRGEIGKPSMILLRRCHKKNIVRGRKWLNDQETGGVLFYTGTHNIDLMCWLMDSEPHRIFCESGQLIMDKSQNFTDSVVVTVQFKNGAIGALYESFGYPDAFPFGADRSVEIIGNAGCLKVDIMQQPLTIYTDSTTQLVDSLVGPRILNRGTGAWVEQARNFIDGISKGQAVSASGKAGLLSIKIAELADRAFRTGEVMYFDAQ